MDRNLLLRIRAETVRLNLEKIRDYLKKLPSRREHLSALYQGLEEMRVLAATVRRDIVGWESDAWAGSGPPSAAAFKQAKESVSSAIERVQAAKEQVEQMQQMSFGLADDDLGAQVSDCLQQRTGEPILLLKKMESAMQKKAPGPADWRDFRSKVVDPSQNIFAEYVELLGGIALRDARFDAGICLLADELIRTYQPNRQKGPLAIPAREQAVSVTLARIIRLSFPEWTIWALPFTAHEFWHIVAEKDVLPRMALAVAPAEVEPRFLDCLADAFATYTMGPAYAYATITLLLDPCAPFTRRVTQAADHIRVEAILKMLERMDSKGSALAPPYAALRQELKKAWEDAIAQAGAAAAPEEKQQLEDDTPAAGLLVDALWNVLEELACSPLTIEAWNQLQDWRDALLTGKVNQLELPVSAELRQVLNAAWLARVDPARDPKLNLTEAAGELASRIRTLKANAAAAPSGPRRGIA